MGFRFRRSIRLMPGVRLNLSTRGVSTSIGGRGATVNIGRRGARATLGIPGTGLSYTTGLLGRTQKGALSKAPGAPPSAPGATLLGWIAIGLGLLLVASCMTSLGSETSSRAPAAAEALTAPKLPMRTVAGQNVNCRAAPVSGAVLARLDRGEPVSVTSQADGWTKVARIGGDCWVSDALLSGS